MAFLKKARPGADSFGNTWPEAGAVVEVADDQAVELLRIPDGGFTEVPAPVEEPAPPARRKAAAKD